MYICNYTSIRLPSLIITVGYQSLNDFKCTEHVLHTCILISSEQNLNRLMRVYTCQYLSKISRSIWVMMTKDVSLMTFKLNIVSQSSSLTRSQMICHQSFSQLQWCAFDLYNQELNVYEIHVQCKCTEPSNVHTIKTQWDIKIKF